MKLGYLTARRSEQGQHAAHWRLTHWKDHDAYQRGLQRLLRYLKQEKV
ncbi:hypothetical protein [Reticulibacter mediterranei]|nr:hypothetical protein [Reticulibacter mediterranei]